MVDSENILGALGAVGSVICARPEESDLIIINTCAFIEPAIQETEETIRKMMKYTANGKKLFIIGCAVNRYGDELRRKFPGVSGWYRLEHERDMIAEICKEAAAIESRLPTTHGYAYLKISEGCSNHCSYCTIPAIKGGFRSFDYNKILEEAYELARLGIKEIILIGQDTTRYGFDLSGKPMLQPLLHDLSEIPEIEWLRIMYAHPKTIDERIFKEIEDNPKICKYIDLPIQHINDRILGLMNRGTSRDQVVMSIERLRQIRNMVIRSTIMVGFPSETEDEFNELMEFAQTGCIDWLGVFPFYPETGTIAAECACLPDELIQDRYETATAIQRKLIQHKNHQRIGDVCKVLIHNREKEYIGHAEFTAPEIDSQIMIKNKTLSPGQFYDVRITSASEHDLHGELA